MLHNFLFIIFTDEYSAYLIYFVAHIVVEMLQNRDIMSSTISSLLAPAQVSVAVVDKRITDYNL